MRIAGLSLAALLLSGGALADPPAAAPGQAVTAPATTVTAPVAASTVPPISGGNIFISPMGEPFHGRDGLSGAEEWFRAADTNHDDKITPQEFEADALRFFNTLDTGHHHLLGPDEITRYETEIAPEIQVTSTYGDPSLAKQNDDGTVTDPPYPTRIGAGRYGFLDSPEPVIAADMNMDRAVSEQEFASTAQRRFKMLDVNTDGVLTRDELPKLSRNSGRGKGGGGGKGGGRHGGRHGEAGGGDIGRRGFGD
jgi:hypothetical protein